jgi:RNA polymerase sigma-70 factor, ECF subfamily
MEERMRALRLRGRGEGAGARDALANPGQPHPEPEDSCSRSAAPEGQSTALLPPDFDTVYEENADFVWRNLRRLGVPDGQLEDACQDAFLVAYRRLGEFAGRSSIRTWLFAIALRVASEHRRKLRRTDGFNALPDEQAAPEPTPLETAERREAAVLLEQFLAGLSGVLRPVFILAELEQMTAPEIGEALGLKVNTVYSRLRLARQALDRAVAGWTARERTQ